MSQLHSRWVTAEDMIRSRAWRAGFESYRLGEPPRFTGQGAKSLAYEYGRQTAAYLRGQGDALPRITAARPVPDHHLPRLATALLACARAGDIPPRAPTRSRGPRLRTLWQGLRARA